MNGGAQRQDGKWGHRVIKGGLFQTGCALVDHLLLHAAVPVVLDGIVGTTGQVFGDFSPFVPEYSMQCHDLFVFFGRKGALFDFRVQVIVPSSIVGVT